jgi:glycosyltransferase involved in cell wall biosynthesis
VVDEGCTGRLFQPGSAADLARQVAWALDHPDAWRAMRTGARRAFEARYTADRNYEVLMRIYRQARARRCSRSAGAADAASTDTSDPPRTPS